jgi:hypothetical protein
MSAQSLTAALRASLAASEAKVFVLNEEYFL